MVGKKIFSINVRQHIIAEDFFVQQLGLIHMYSCTKTVTVNMIHMFQLHKSTRYVLEFHSRVQWCVNRHVLHSEAPVRGTKSLYQSIIFFSFGLRANLRLEEKKYLRHFYLYPKDFQCMF